MNNDFINSIMDGLLEGGIKKDLAIKSLRVFCRRYGGQKIYFSTSAKSKRASEIFKLIYEELNEENEEVAFGTSEKITRIFLKNFYNVAEYVPIEIKAFQKEIAFEINEEYAKSSDKNKTQIEICNKYNISFVTFLKLRNLIKKKSKNL